MSLQMISPDAHTDLIASSTSPAKPRVLLPDVGRFPAVALMVGLRIDLRSHHWQHPLALSPLTVSAGDHGYAMIFRYGVVVFFEVEAPQQTLFLEALSPYVSDPLESYASERAVVEVRPEPDSYTGAGGQIYIGDSSLGRLQTVAHVLSKSALLTHYELNVSLVFQQLEPLAEQLRGGRPGSSGKSLRRQLGDVLLVQTQTVGRAEVAEKPKIAWEHAELDRMYEHLAREFELADRDVALSRKLQLISETTGTFVNLLQNRQSLRVEWSIVILIVMVIVLFAFELFVG